MRVLASLRFAVAAAAALFAAGSAPAIFIDSFNAPPFGNTATSPFNGNPSYTYDSNLSAADTFRSVRTIGVLRESGTTQVTGRVNDGNFNFVQQTAVGSQVSSQGEAYLVWNGNTNTNATNTPTFNQAPPVNGGAQSLTDLGAGTFKLTAGLVGGNFTATLTAYTTANDFIQGDFDLIQSPGGEYTLDTSAMERVGNFDLNRVSALSLRIQGNTAGTNLSLGSLEFNAIPEPSTYALSAVVLLALGTGYARRRRSAPAAENTSAKDPAAS